MDATELRIGNYVSLPDKPYFAFRVNGDSICNFWNGTLDIHPCELNEDWLQYLGFKPLGKDWQLNGIIVHTRKRGYVINKKVPIIKHVHQLQNYYYANRNEEL